MQKIKYVTITLPEDVFDVEGATVVRRKRVSVAEVDRLRNLGKTVKDPKDAEEELYEGMAKIWPRWDGVVDVDSGELLPNPETNPFVFARLGITEQLPWFMGAGLKVRPNGKRRR